ncbi:MAG: LysR family transcriptional activator of nhaA [Myxococcota bacterium]|jgi:LysR family transcriptional activator of nhaA
MDDLNYHHLKYFWAVARSETLTSAAGNLGLTPQTLSTQIKSLEQSLGQHLFARSGRRLVLTDMGQAVFRYAEQIFAIGDELTEMVAGRTVGRALQVVVGVADVLPKLVAHRLIEPALELDEPVRVVCRATGLPSLLADLMTHRIDVVLSDAPIPSSVRIRAFNHLLGECGVTFMASKSTAREYRRGFPQSLDRAPMLLPAEGTALRRQLEDWFTEHEIRPKIVGEFEDSALLKAFGQAGTGVFPVPSIVAEEVGRQYHAKPIGVVDGVVERFYAISVERRVTHPAVAAICTAARTKLFE